jgi:hypothetical protein
MSIRNQYELTSEDCSLLIKALYFKDIKLVPTGSIQEDVYPDPETAEELKSFKDVGIRRGMSNSEIREFILFKGRSMDSFVVVNVIQNIFDE